MNHLNTNNASNHSEVNQITNRIHTLIQSHAQIVWIQLFYAQQLLSCKQVVQKRVILSLRVRLNCLLKFNYRGQIRDCTFLFSPDVFCNAATPHLFHLHKVDAFVLSHSATFIAAVI